MERICAQCHAVLAEGTKADWCPACGGALVERLEIPAQATVNANDLHLAGAVKSARDLWKHEGVQFTDGKYTSAVPSHGILMLRVSAR